MPSASLRPAQGISPLIRLRGVSKTYDTPSGPFTALSGIDLDVRAGEFLGVVGRSGSGKSTLINLITGIDRPSRGEVWVGETAVHALSEQRLAMWRGVNVGIVFQFFQLLPSLTVAENVMLPMDFCGTYGPHERRARALALLDRFGIAEQADKLPATLSGGQQQRAAIARALANDPPLLVADEPTGNLDSHTSDLIIGAFADLVQEGRTVVMVTHMRDLSAQLSRSITLVDGRPARDSQPAPERAHA